MAPQRDIRALTGARWPAAFLVVMYHLAVDPDVLLPFRWFGLDTVFRRGALGVDFFFILSGFIIHHVYRETFAARVTAADWRRFVRYRFARLWPVHVVTLAGALGLFAVAAAVLHRTPPDAASYTPLALLNTLLMTHAWFGFGTPNIPAWSISAEWAAYLAYPLAAWAIPRLPAPAVAALGLAVLLGTAIAAVANPMVRIALEFTLGMALRELEGRWSLSDRLPPASGIVLVALALAGCWVLPRDALTPFVAVFAALVLALCRPNDVVARLAARPVAVYLGEVSYALYMVHSDVWSALKNAARLAAPSLDLQGPLLVTLGVLLSCAAASAVHHGVELPCRLLLRGRRAPAPVAA